MLTDPTPKTLINPATKERLPLRVLMARHERERLTVKFQDTDEPSITNTYDRYSIGYYLKNYHHVELPKDFDWRLVVNNGKNRGKIETRIAKLAGVDSVNSICSILRNGIIDAVSRAKLTVYIDWTFLIDWTKGDFGDPRSCYFPPSGYIASMHANGVGAIRVYKNNNPDTHRGIARAWMAVDQPRDYIVTIYNRYGEGSCLLFAEYVAKALNMLGYGKYYWDETRVTYTGCAHINGDAAILWHSEYYPDGIKQFKNSNGRIQLQLIKEKL